MPRNAKKNTLQPLKLLELLGKPILFLFTITGLLLVTYLHLISIFTHQITRFVLNKSHLFKKHLSNFSLPQLTLPHISLPRIPSFRKRLHFPKTRIVLPLLTLTLLSLTFYLTILKDLPDPHLLSNSLPSLSTKIFDRNGTLLYKIYRDENRTLIKLSNLPQHLVDATIAAEDKSFYQHKGLDFTAIIRALFNNFTCWVDSDSCTSIQGASTITQQLVKNSLLTPERTIIRKLKEAVLALWIEQIFTKDEILELYFNYVPYGGTAYGIEEGSRYYLDKASSELNLAESALLAGLPIAPTTLSPFGINPYLAKHRQDQVLDRMVIEEYITKSQADLAKSTPLTFATHGNGILAPHFVMYIQSQLVNEYGKDLVHYGGLEVTTTLDLSLQQILEENIRTELTSLKHLNVGNGAGIILDARTGEILAMAGSRDFFDLEHDGQVNATLSSRQPGSAIKPLTYSLALTNGLSPSTRIDDSPICFTSSGQAPYCPKNYDGKFHGNVTLRTALASSYNIPAIKLLNSLGVDRLVGLARKLGITTWDDPSQYGLALTLGGGNVTLLELASAYATFARGGTYLPTQAILTTTNHHILPTTTISKAKQVLSPEVSYQISNILSDNQARSPAFGLNSVLSIRGHEVAVKTGTSNDLRDNWTLGYTSDYVVAIWVGNNDNTPMSQVASGITGASPIWASTMQTLLKGSSPHKFHVPTNLVQVNLSCSGTPHYDYFVPGTQPKIDCNPKPEGEIL